MNIYVTIQAGKVVFRGGDHGDPAEFDQGDRTKLIDFLQDLFEGGWDGHMVCSENLNWPERFGWINTDDEGDPYRYLRNCIRSAREAQAQVAHSRVETGVLEFHGDWPGVFIRGDNAGHFCFLLEGLIRDVEQGEKTMSVIDIAQLRGLARLLASSDVGREQGHKHPVLHAYKNCLKRES